MPLTSPWGMPPFAAPTPDDSQEPAKGRNPYSSPTADPETEPRRRPRRTVDRPDKLVASGPPRPVPAPDTESPPSTVPRPYVGYGDGGERETETGRGTGTGARSGAGSWFDAASRPSEAPADRAKEGDPRRRTEAPGQASAQRDRPPSEEQAAPEGRAAARPEPETRPQRGARTAPYRMTHRPPPPGATPAAAEGAGHEEPARRDDDATRPGEVVPGSAAAVGGVARKGGEESTDWRDDTRHDTAKGGQAATDTGADSVRHDAGDDAEDVRDDRGRDVRRGEGDGEELVRRVGRPPGGRPTRPDLLVASGPAGGRHQRGPAPAAVRRSSPMRRRRSAAVPIAVALALAVLVAGGVLVWQWRDTGDPGLRLATGTGRSGDELFTVPASTGQGSNQKLNDMASAGGAVVAVGSDTTSPTPRPLFLFSPDGKKWQLGKVTGSTTPTVQRVVGGAGRWLASGGDGLNERGLWTSTDGLTWQAVEPSGLAAFRNGDLVHDIARTASGFVAVGRTALQDGGSGAAAWHSADGRAWERVDTRGLDVGELKAVVAKGDTVVALAQPAQGEGARVIRSADGGRAWEATGFQLPEALPRIGTLAVTPKRFVLVPTRQRTITGEVRVYCSPTGAAWSQCGTIGGLSEASPGVESLISHASGVAAVSLASLGGYSVLNSADGRAWTERAEFGDLAGATLRGFTISPGGTLFAGGDQAAADVDNQLVLMAAPPRGKPSRVRLAQVDGLSRVARETSRLAGHEGRYVAVGSASGDAGIWTSLNWQDWTSISLGGPGLQQLHDVAFGRRGWLAAGGTQSALQVTEPLLVTSQDGREWKKVAISGDLARPGDHPHLDTRVLAAGPKGYVLAGEGRGPSGTVSAAIWFTPDLRRFTRSKRLPQGGSDVRVHDLAATPAGYVAVGGAGAGSDESGVVWVSEDGVNWKARKRVAPPDSTSAGLRQVATYQDRLVAIGTAQTSSGARRAFSAISEDDGATWKTSWLPAEQAAAVYDLAAAEHGLVAVGWHGRPGEGDSAAWVSQDGETWSRLDLTKDRLAGQGSQWLTAVTVAGEEVVALGRSTTYSDDHLILWTSTLTSNR
ncbi:hypothetical protein [Nonomuraea sp. LPB2021202275-12-8]|uniref:hypothetical protein n=1 Tax=Nonomuraea sp. LPB2021202275-12-8 TaxID=3120159 RepID=UPI00300D64F4